MNKPDNISVTAQSDENSLSVTLQTMFDGMEGLLQSKTVIGDPIDMGDVKLLPLLEISAGLAGGSFAASAKQRGASAMTAKITPVAMLMVKGSMVRLINIKNQDAVTRLVDLIPDVVDKFTGSRIYAQSVAKAEAVASKLGIKVVHDMNSSEKDQDASDNNSDN